MRIGLNLLYLLPGIVGGTESYASGLLHGLAEVDRQNEYLVFVNKESQEWPLPQAPNFTRVNCPVSASSRIQRYLFEQLRLPRLLRRYSIQVVHSLGYTSPLFASCPTVVTVHDLNYRAFGSWMPAARRAALELIVRQSSLRASRIIAVSEFSRREICREFGLSASGVAVINEAASAAGPGGPSADKTVTFGRLGITDPYALAFSSWGPNKNISRLLRAFSDAKRQYPLPHQLVLVGHAPERGIAEARSSDGTVVFTGYLDQESLQAVLRGADFLVFPSLYEGFGLPVLEAMAAGVPVACSNTASLPEVAGDAASYFDPTSIDDMAQKIVQLALNPGFRGALREKGYLNVRRFSWERAARETIAVYEAVGAGGKS